MNKSYPKVRIYLSMSLLDLRKERNLLYQEVFPTIKRECMRLGIPFSIIDLRDRLNDKEELESGVLDLCLDEIKHSKPYFIGVIGKIDDSSTIKYDESLKEKYNLDDNSDNHTQEVSLLEKVIGDNLDRCFFYMKHNDLVDGGLDRDHIKNALDEKHIDNKVYTSLDEFKAQVIYDLENAINSDFPDKESLMFNRQEAYLSSHDDKFIPRIFLASQALDILTKIEEEHTPTLVVCDFRIGKTEIFNRMISSKKDVDKIIINFEADHIMQHYPHYFLRKQIYTKLKALDYTFKDYEELPFGEYALSSESVEQGYMGSLKRDIEALVLKRPLYILINDINLIYDNDSSKTFYRNFIFDKNMHLPEDLHVIITTNNDDQRELLPIRSIDMRPSLDDSRFFFKDYLKRNGKEIEIEDLKDASPSLKYLEYKYIAEYLINYSDNKTFESKLNELIKKNNFYEIMKYAFEDVISNMSEKCASVYTEILLRLKVFSPGFTLGDLFLSYDKETAIEELKEHHAYVDLSEVEKAIILKGLRYFTNTEADLIYIDDPNVKEFIAQEFPYLLNVIKRTYDKRAEASTNELFKITDTVVKYGKSLTKEEYLKLLVSDSEKNQEILYQVLNPLSAYLDKMINDFSEGYFKSKNNIFDPNEYNEEDFKILTYIKEASKLYKSNTRADLYYKLLNNPRLIMFIASKSLTLLRELVSRYIDLYFDIQNREMGHTDDDATSFALNYAFESFIEYEPLNDNDEWVKSNGIENIVLELDERNLLSGKFKNLYDEGSTRVLMTDYAVSLCSSEIVDSLYDTDYTVYSEEDDKEIIQLLNEFIIRYKESVSYYDKVYYAFYIIEMILGLANNENLDDKYNEVLNGILKNIEKYLRYVFFPDINAMFDIYFGRIFPQKIIARLRLGIDTLKELHYESSLDDWEETYDYFMRNE